MNRKNKVLTIFMLGVLISSIYFSALTKGAVAPDLLELTKDSYVKGKLLFTNTSVADHVVADIEIQVVNIVNFTDLSMNMVQIRILYDIADNEFLGLDEVDHLDYTSLVLESNRTVAFPVVEFTMSNSSYYAKASLLDETTVDDVTNFNNTKVTIDGTTYRFGDVDVNDTKYDEIAEIMAGMLLFNLALGLVFVQTVFAISPQTNVADTINFNPSMGSVIDKPAIITSLGDSYNTIHVKYDNTFTFGLDDVGEVETFYEAKTGLLIRSIEKDTASDTSLEFLPSEVNIARAGLIPYPITGIVVGFIAIGLIAVFIQKKK